MISLFGALAGYKTYIVAGMTVLGAVAGYLTGTVNAHDALQVAIPAILACTVRGGVTHEANITRASVQAPTPPAS